VWYRLVLRVVRVVRGLGTLEGSGFHPQGPVSTCRLSKMPLTIRIRITAVGLLLSPLLSVGISLVDRRVDLDRIETIDSGSEVVAHRERESEQETSRAALVLDYTNPR